MKSLILTTCLLFTFSALADQVRIMNFPSPNGVDSQCRIFMDANMIQPGPSYKQMMHLMQFKPATQSLVSNYLQLEEDRNPFTAIPQMAFYSERQYQGTPGPGQHSMSCSRVQPLAAELNMMLASRFKPNPLPPLLNPAGTSTANSGGPAIFPAECWGRVDLQACKSEVEGRAVIELPILSADCWGRVDLQACQAEVDGRGTQVTE